jgi:hypothetical protein
MILIELINLSLDDYLAAFTLRQADATVKIAISPVKNAFSREEKHAFASESATKCAALTFSEHR